MKEILITSSVLIAVVLLLRWLLRGKVSQRLIYGAWLLVALRLLIPVQLGQWQYSFTALMEKAPVFEPVEQVLETPVAGPDRQELYDQLLQEHWADNQPLYADPDASEVPDSVSPVIRQQLMQQAQEQITAPSLSEILTAIWIVGICGMAAWFLTANVLFLRRAKKDSVPLTGCDSKVPVRISPNVPTPCLTGLFRPVIYLTPACAHNEQMRTHVLTHELSHLRHGDHLWSIVRCVCLCVYWFHPLVWIAGIQSRRDCELACDESALKQLDDTERIAYGKTLLDIVSQSLSPVHLLETPTSMNETKRQLTERVRFISKKRKNLLVLAISLVLAAVITAGCAFLGSPRDTVVTHGADAGDGYRYVYLVKEVTDYYSNGAPQQRTSYTYDDHGRVTVQDRINYFSDSFNQKLTYHRNERGLLSYVESESSTGKEASTYDYTFREDGSVASYVRTDFGSTNYYYDFEYDIQGRLSKVSLAYSSNKGKPNYFCFYDADGRLYKVVYSTGTTSYDVCTLTYDDQGRLSSVRSNDFNGSNYDCEYDAQGRLTGQMAPDWARADLVYSYTGSVLTGIEYVIDPRCSTLEPRTYTLDDAGNVSTIVYEDGKCTAYTYELVKLPEADAQWILHKHPVNNGEATGIEAYRYDFLKYFIS